MTENCQRGYIKIPGKYEGPFIITAHEASQIGSAALRRASRTRSEEESAPDFFDLFASTLMGGMD